MGIGPSTKETTLHHFRDPLIDAVSNDSDFDLVGIIVAGTPRLMMIKFLLEKELVHGLRL